MAKLLIMKSDAPVTTGYCKGDIVGVYNNNEVGELHSVSRFAVVEITDKTKEELETYVQNQYVDPNARPRVMISRRKYRMDYDAMSVDDKTLFLGKTGVIMAWAKANPLMIDKDAV